MKLHFSDKTVTRRRENILNPSKDFNFETQERIFDETINHGETFEKIIEK